MQRANQEITEKVSEYLKENPYNNTDLDEFKEKMVNDLWGNYCEFYTEKECYTFAENIGNFMEVLRFVKEEVGEIDIDDIPAVFNSAVAHAGRNYVLGMEESEMIEN
jgi:predicted house-cleaning noncanonical NTP pyrophosphatase (MazG superfamily)